MDVTLPPEIPRDVSILVVDDIPSARKVICKILSNLGFSSVQEANSLAEARQKVRLLGPKLVIIDLHLKDGAATGLLEGDSPLTGEQLIVVTSDMEQSSLELLQKAGITQYLIKPFPPSALAEKLMVALA